MFRTFSARLAPSISGGLALVAYLVAALALPDSTREILRENGFDLLLAADRLLPRPDAVAPRAARTVVVDIDRHSLEVYGPWPWSRTTMARLVDAVAMKRPRVMAIDILFADPDTRSPAALARSLNAFVKSAQIYAMAETLPDGDKLLSDAIGRTSAVLGFVLDPSQDTGVPGPPVLIRGQIRTGQFWRSKGAVGPIPQLARAGRGSGALSLASDADGAVRHVPLLVEVAGQLRPGLAIEAVRLSLRGSAYLVEATSRMLLTENLRIPIPPDGLLRLLPVSRSTHLARTISAADVIANKGDLSLLADAVVFLGGSAPELGGLRRTVTEPLISSAQIQADAATQIMDGRVPQPLPTAVQFGAALAAGVVALAAGAMLSPWLGLAVILAVAAIDGAASILMSIHLDRLLDPIMPMGAAATVLVVTSAVSYADTRRRAAQVRRKFEQHLAPAVVRQIVDNPDLVKLSGERRDITALFTDIQNFTAMTHRATPHELVKLLDGYIEGVADIVIRHGGMVDKIVGDAVHAIFNAPIDLDDHPTRALDCAMAIREWTERYRSTPEAGALGLERTRIGLETGSAIVGDVGIRTKLDYTAHGDVMNAASRLEAANKELGSSICIGPAAAARIDAAAVRPLGKTSLRGLGDLVPVFEPWPHDMPPSRRERYLEAFRMIDQDRDRAAALFEQLAGEDGGDQVPGAMARRLRRAL